MNERVNTDLDQLVRDGAWLRRFVGTLVASQDIDDVTQASWLAAVEGRGQVRGGIASWLRGVACNLARMLHRSHRRRTRVVQQLPGRGDAASAADVVAGLEVQRAVSEALLSLPEPTRTILVLRYQDGLSPAAIAPRVGLKADAVRQRLHRGREAVRERLQQRFGTDWRGSAAIAAFVHDARVAVSLAAVPMLGAAALAGAMLVMTTLAVSPLGSRVAVPTARAESSSTRTEPTPSPVAAAPLPERVLIAGQPLELAPAAATAARIEVRGRLIAAEGGSPLAGASIVRDADTSTPPITSDRDGRFVVAYDADSKRGRIWFRADGRCERCCEHQPQSIDFGDIPLARGYEVSGLVVDEADAPIANARLGASFEGGVPDGSIGFEAVTKPDGTFVFAQLLPAGPIVLHENSPELRRVDGNPEVEVLAGGSNHFLLRMRRLRSMSGVVFDPEGRPCAGVDLTIFPTAEPDPNLFVGASPSAADGSFEMFENEAWPAAYIDVGHHAAHELVGPRVRCEWGARGVRIVVRPRIPVRLLVVEAESGKPVTTFAASARRTSGGNSIASGSRSPEERPDGRYAFAGLAANTHVVVYAPDPERAPVVLVVDESMRTQPEIRIALPKLQTFPLELIDARGAPIAAEFDVIDRRGTPTPDAWSDYLAGKEVTRGFVPVSPFRVSGGSTDAAGKGTLRAPTDRRDLAVRLSRGKQHVWLPIHPPANSQPLRLVVPD